MPAARKPDMMFEIVLPACQMAMRIGFSCFVYQDEVMRVMPGKKGASVRPTIKRQIQKPTPLGGCQSGTFKVVKFETYLVIAGIQMVAALQASIMVGRNQLGFVFASHKLPGSWPIR
jgi:hypothetical protein